MQVTDANKAEYVELMAVFHLTNGRTTAMAAFRDGFHDVVPAKTLAAVNLSARDLELLLCGETKIDVEDWRTHTLLEGFSPQDPIVVWFWEAVAARNETERAKLLAFCTGTPRVPAQGFQMLRGSDGPRLFTLRRTESTCARLPVAHTCHNRLDLPCNFDSAAALARALNLAVDGSEGFAGD